MSTSPAYEFGFLVAFLLDFFHALVNHWYDSCMHIAQELYSTTLANAWSWSRVLVQCACKNHTSGSPMRGKNQEEKQQEIQTHKQERST
jgi:hypothetical protein